jgi:hypothetical protein
MTINYDEFWKGPDEVDRRRTYASDYSPTIEANGVATVDACNPLIEEYEAETGFVVNQCRSGWRPKRINDRTANSGAMSAHIDALAEDDTGEDDLEMRTASDGTAYGSSRFARWCATHQDRLKFYGLHMEDWHYTARRHADGTWAVWCHLTTRAPHSGHTMYMPFDPNENPPPISLREVA